MTTNPTEINQCFSFWEQNFAKFGPEKYDFKLYKGFFHGENDPNLPDFKGKKSKLPDFYHKLFPVGSKECRKDSGFVFFTTFISSFSLIWLNHLMNNCHFSYITKLKKKKKKPEINQSHWAV
jgi:hypothetical protein